MLLFLYEYSWTDAQMYDSLVRHHCARLYIIVRRVSA